MEYANWLLIGMVGLFLLKQFLPAKGVRTIGTEELKPLLKDKSIQFIDVRTPGEFGARHIREFKNIPLNQIGQKATHLDMEKEVVVICQSGMRSNKAAKQLKKLGFKKVINIKGGMNTWP
ncbi:rhodanese-like domain-containing protein [Bacillus sp. FJAT-27445]|uniref:rhodanese-like domain-containing protein n=1 Tax=Bacillus sp. FJAT-27445 TaxID=1679166 RepID=UPI000743477E|nr:rhodanese-like domain-containing protein [Bacillus sp. FJAT-27445]